MSKGDRPIKWYQDMLLQKEQAHARMEARQIELIKVNEEQRKRLIDLTMHNDMLRTELARLQKLERDLAGEMKGTPAVFDAKKKTKDETDRPLVLLGTDPEKAVRICMARNHHNFEKGKCNDCGANEVRIGVQSEDKGERK